MSLRTGCARIFRLLSTLGALAISLSACVNLGTGIKTLGQNLVGGNGTGTTDADSFAVTFAYRDPTNDASTPNRTVSVQGIQGSSAANLVNECGATGATCACDIFRSATDPSPVTTASPGISQQNNSVSCVIPATITDAQIKANPAGFYVRLKRTDNTTKNTGLISIQTTLTIGDVLGPNLSKTYVRGIFRYTCNRTFFEGEGVSANNITCVAGQHLGVINATYTYYVYRSGVDSNSPGGDSAFPSDICKRNNFLKIQCTGNTPQLRYGFYNPPQNGQAGPFVVGITMTSAPEGTNLTSNYGFAALPDSAGNCPTGLVKVRPWVAQPASIIQGSLDGTNPPSSFINTGNSLNDTVVEQTQPSNFIVTRQPNIVQCNTSTGDCTNAAFGGAVQAESVAYTPLTPVVCAIPSSLLSGLF